MGTTTIVSFTRRREDAKKNKPSPSREGLGWGWSSLFLHTSQTHLLPSPACGKGEGASALWIASCHASFAAKSRSQ